MSADAGRELCARYDGPAFDPKGETLPLDFFEPMVRRVMARPRSETSIKAMEATAAKVPA